VEIRAILRFIKKNKKAITVSLLAGILLGCTYFFVPKKFTATGSFFVSRKIDSLLSESYFKYEGYYSQQTALSYTNSIVALLESTDLTSKSLEKLGTNPTEKNLRKYKNLIKVKKAGPQVITLTVKGNTPEKAEILWNTLSQMLMEETKKVSELGDTNLNITKVSPEPVVKEGFNSLPLDIAAFALVSFTLGTFILSIKEYSSKGKKK